MKNNNKAIIILVLMGALIGCARDESAGSAPKAALGSDRDEHGCIGSAGYIWCALTGECERPWELAEKEGFESTQVKFEEYCGE